MTDPDIPATALDETSTALAEALIVARLGLKDGDLRTRLQSASLVVQVVGLSAKLAKPSAKQPTTSKTSSAAPISDDEIRALIMKSKPTSE